MSEAQHQHNKWYVRFSIFQRVEHWILFLSFSTLGLTGLPQKYPLSPISRGVVAALGGIETIRVIHRVAATIFLLEAIYHLVVIGYKLFVRREEASMLPTLKDGTDAVQSIQYNLGMRKDAPKMPRFNFAEKAEYWAMLWGLFVMAVTGFMLWNPIATTTILPGEFIPAAKVAHGGEAVLAVLAIILWHFWHVHIRSFNTSIFTGKMSRHHMADEHGAELERLETGNVRVYAPVDAQRKRRVAIFTPVAAVVSLALLAGVYWFVSFEQTSITTLPPSTSGEAFVPQTATPGPTAAPTEAAPEGSGDAAVGAPGWTGDVETLFAEKCTSCHGSMGGFNAETYDAVLTGLTPGEPDSSDIVKVQRAGGHPGMFTEEALQRVVDWIAAGAPEEAGAAGADTGAAAANTTASASTWDGGVADVFAQRCAACHGSGADYSVTSYAGVMDKITAGEPDDSDVIELVAGGKHPGKFTAEELQLVRDWIAAGAPEK